MVSACRLSGSCCGLADQDLAGVYAAGVDLVEGESEPPKCGFNDNPALIVETAEPAVETFAPVLHETKRDFRQFAGEPLVILGPRQGRSIPGELTSSV